MKRTILILSLFLGMLNSTFAQGNEMSLTIEEAKQYAINHNRSLQSPLEIAFYSFQILNQKL